LRAHLPGHLQFALPASAPECQSDRPFQMITPTDSLLAFFAALGGSTLGAIITPKRSMEAFNRGLGFKFPRLWGGILLFTLALPLILGGMDARTGGSWIPWIFANVAISVSWLVTIWLRVSRMRPHDED